MVVNKFFSDIKVSFLDPSVSVRVKQSLMCRFLHTLFCSCFHQFGRNDEINQIISLARAYQYTEEQLVCFYATTFAIMSM